MEMHFLRSPSIGSLVKKLLAINPELGTGDLIAIVKASTVRKDTGEFTGSETIDEPHALELARQTVA